MSFSKFVLGSFVWAILSGCSSDPEDPAYKFGETDMQSAVLGAWSGSLTLSGQTATSLTMNIVQVPTLQPACGSRTFNAPQCVELSSMNIEATITTADKSFDGAKLPGTFDVIGLEFNNGELSLSGNGVFISGGIDPTNTSQDLTISGSLMGTVNMQR